MINVSISKKIRKAIAKQMSKTQRRAWKNGETVKVEIDRFGRPLKRWGADENRCRFTLRKNSVIENNLFDMAWSDEPLAAWIEAQNAIEYFIYGAPSEYKISISIA